MLLCLLLLLLLLLPLLLLHLSCCSSKSRLESSEYHSNITHDNLPVTVWHRRPKAVTAGQPVLSAWQQQYHTVGILPTRLPA